MEKTPDDLGAFIKKGCNIGLVCGKASGIDALDLDIDFFTSELLDGCTVETLSSGHRDGRGHLLFQHDNSLYSEKHHFIGIEYFGNNKEGAGSNLVLPPSIHVSGEVYKWKNPDVTPTKIPDRLKENMLALFKKEDALHGYFNKCRHCFTKGSKKYPKEDPRSKGLWDRPDNITVHGMDGRRAVIAIMGELRNVGCTDELMHMACKRFFGKDYKYDETAENLKHIKPIPPKCETLRQVLNIECEGCTWAPKPIPNAIPKEKVVLGEKICATCLFRPQGGVGGCKNPENKTIEGKQKRNKYTTDEMPACEKYHEKPKKVREVKERIEKKIAPREPDPELERAMGMYTDRIQLAEELQKIIPFYFDESRNFWMWKKDVKYYKMIDETDILSCVRHNSREYVVSSTLKNEIIESIRITGRERKVLDVEKNWMRFNENGYDLKTKEYFDPKPTHFHSAPIPHNIGDSYESPVIDALFTDWVGDRKGILYEIAAYCLLDDYPIHRMFILFGGGRNGKGQFMEFLTRLVGEKNTTSTELELLMKSRFEAAKLYKKKLALIGETDFSTIKDTAKIKKITGDDMIGGEFKQKKPFDFKNTAKIIISTNSIPETLDKTDAFFSRCIIVEFKNRFDISAPVIDLIPEKEYENFIKNVVEHTLPALLVRGVFKDEGTIEEKAEKYEKLSNPFSSFKDRELIEDIDSDIPVWVVREMYEEFCALNKFRKLGEKEFTMTLNKAGITTKKTRFGEKTWNAVIGFKTKNPRVWSLTEEAKSSGCSICSTPYDKIIHIGNQVQPTGTCRTCGTLAIQKALKEKYDLFNKPESILDLGRMQETMKLWITTEFEGSEKLNCARIVEDYCQTRTWC